MSPGRSDGGQRLYSDRDVSRLTMLTQAMGAGRSISSVAELSDEQLRALLEEDARVRPSVASVPNRAAKSSTAESVLEASLTSVEQLDGSRLENQLLQAAVLLDPAALIDDVVLPLLEQIGRLWEHGVVGPATEHVASVAVRRFLDWLLTAIAVSEDAPSLVCATPSGHRHEFGALIAAVSGAHAGWRTTFLGADLPPDEIAAAVRRLGASAVALSAVFPIADPTLPVQVSRLMAQLPPGTRVMIGGPAVEGSKDHLADAGAIVLDSLADLRELLRSLPLDAE